MRPATVSPARRALRWVVLFVVLASIAVNYVVVNSLEIGRGSVGQVSDRFSTLITPASYAFAIWGVIFAAMIVYAIVQLAPSQRTKPVYDALAWPLIGFSALSAMWSPVFQTEAIGLATLIIFAALGCAAVGFVRAHAAVALGHHRRWLTVPFSMMLAWIAVATIVCVATLLVSRGWAGGPLSAQAWAVIMTVIAAGLGLRLAVRYRDPLVPAVVAWAAFAIWSARLEAEPAVAAVALAAAAANAFGAVWAGWQLGHLRRGDRRGSLTGPIAVRTSLAD